MYKVYCLNTRDAVPVYAAAFDTIEGAADRMNDIISHARLARSLGDKGDKYLAQIYKIIVKDSEGNICAECMRDENADES